MFHLYIPALVGEMFFNSIDLTAMAIFTIVRVGWILSRFIQDSKLSGKKTKHVRRIWNNNALISYKYVSCKYSFMLYECIGQILVGENVQKINVLIWLSRAPT